MHGVNRRLVCSGTVYSMKKDWMREKRINTVANYLHMGGHKIYGYVFCEKKVTATKR